MESRRSAGEGSAEARPLAGLPPLGHDDHSIVRAVQILTGRLDSMDRKIAQINKENQAMLERTAFLVKGNACQQEMANSRVPETGSKSREGVAGAAGGSGALPRGAFANLFRAGASASAAAGRVPARSSRLMAAARPAGASASRPAEEVLLPKTDEDRQREFIAAQMAVLRKAEAAVRARAAAARRGGSGGLPGEASTSGSNVRAGPSFTTARMPTGSVGSQPAAAPAAGAAASPAPDEDELERPLLIKDFL